nr:hypothetical protein [Tanacetum cinerariifolium]
MDYVVQQSSVDKQCLENAKKELFLENDRLLHQFMSHYVLLTVMNYMSLIDESVNVERKRNESCDKCFNLEPELLKSQNAHNDLLKRCSQLEKYCISLESSIQLNQENFQKDESCDNQNALEIPEFFEKNDLKAQLQDKDISPKLLQNKEAHIDYLKYTHEQADILRGIVEQAKAKQPLDKVLDFAKPQILLQAWFKFFAIKRAQPENSNELFQKLLEYLKELAEYKESLENSSKEIAVLNSNPEKEEPPQNFDIGRLIREECCVKASEEQKQNMEDTILELAEICHQKELLCMHDYVDDLIESALNTKLLSINSQRLDKKEQEVKNVMEQPAERRTLAPILSTKEPDYSPSMGYEHPNTTPKTESDEIIKSGVEELVPILSQTSDDDDFDDIEYVEASLPDPEIVSLEEENVVHHEEEEVDLEDISQIQNVVLREKLLSINRLITNIESLNDNPTPDRVLNSSVSIPIFEESNNSLSNTFSPEFETFCDHTEETRSGNTTTHANDSLPEYDSFCFEIESDQERLINVLKNDISDNSTNDPLLEEADLFLASNNSIPPGIENFSYDPEGDIRFLKHYLSMIPFLFLTMNHLNLRITRHFHDLLRNHQMLI